MFSKLQKKLRIQKEAESTVLKINHFILIRLFILTSKQNPYEYVQNKPASEKPCILFHRARSKLFESTVFFMIRRSFFQVSRNVIESASSNCNLLTLSLI